MERETTQPNAASQPRAFAGRVAFVTGAGGGMGRRIAADLAGAGARVFAVDVKDPPSGESGGSESVVGPWRAQCGREAGASGEGRPEASHEGGREGGRGHAGGSGAMGSGVSPGKQSVPPRQAQRPAADDVTYWQFDVTEEDRVAGALDEVYAACGRLDYVVNGAGIGWFDRDGPVAAIERAVWERVLDVNLTAAMLVCRHALPLVERSGGGAFVHLASVAGLRNADDPMDAYQVSKAGLISLSRAVALQYGPLGIRSNTICPGAILTPMIQPLYDADPARAERMAGRTPLRRLGTVADVSSACRFLLSDAASFITGVDLVVDGGWTLALP